MSIMFAKRRRLIKDRGIYNEDIRPILSYMEDDVMAERYEIQQRLPDGFACRNIDSGLVVLVSIATESDGFQWIHVSMSYSSYLPSYQTMKDVKSLFIGDDREAYQVFPKKNNHVNDMQYCLHLWARVNTNPVLPDFTRGGGTI